MRIAIGADHAGFELKSHLVTVLTDLAHTVVDMGTDSTDSVDYPAFCAAVGRAVARGDAERYADAVDVHVFSDARHRLALQYRRNAARMLDYLHISDSLFCVNSKYARVDRDLQTTQHVAFRVGQRLALLFRYVRREFTLKL